MAQTKDLIITEDMVLNTLNNHASELMQLSGVVAVGLGECNGTPCIRVLSKDHASELTKELPKEINGIKVELVVSGEVKAR